MPAAVTLYDSVLALHIAAVVVAFGATFTAPLTFRLAARDPRGLPLAWRIQHTIDTRVVGPGMVVVLLAGAYLATDGDSWSEPWVSFALVAILVIGGVVGAVLIPRERRALELAEHGPSPELAALERQVLRIGEGLAVLILVTIYVMTAKPFS